MGRTDEALQYAYDNYRIDNDPSGFIGNGIMDSVSERANRKGMTPDQWLVWVRKGKKEVPDVRPKERKHPEYTLDTLKVLRNIAYASFSEVPAWEKGVSAAEIRRRCSKLKKAGYVHLKSYSHMNTVQLRNYIFSVKGDINKKFHDLTSKFD